MTSNATGAEPGAEQSAEGDLFRPVASARMSAMIVDQIRQLILAKRLRDGDRLPPERELAGQFGVSRLTVRDAFRMLQSAGLVDVRVGARGGAVITKPTGVRLGEGVADLLLFESLEAAEVTEARQVVELAIVDLVCERATEEDLTALREICDRSEEALADASYTPDLSTEFHLRLANCAHNRALNLMITSFRGAIRQSLLAARGGSSMMSEEGVREHRAVVEAVAARDPSGARQVLASHLRRTAARLRAVAEATGIAEPS